MASNSFGEILRLTTFGESHGPAIGGVLDGFPSGIEMDFDFIEAEMARRKPGQSSLTTPRAEDDAIVFLSGIFNGITTGAPIAFTIANKDQRSQDYETHRGIYRPGHADEVYDKKYGHRDYRGGGRSSARETAVRVAAGALCKVLLRSLEIEIYAYVHSIEKVVCKLDPLQINPKLIETNPVRCPDPMTALEMIACIEHAKDSKDSVGGVINAVMKNLPVGLGDPIYQKLNARLGYAMLSINAVQGFEMHRAFERSQWRGSQNNSFKTGVSAGITTGDPLVCAVAFKPTSTIALPQQAKTTNNETTILASTGRHDPCVLPRAVPIVEAMCALVIADAYLSFKSQQI
jgi:chorismate synthase